MLIRSILPYFSTIYAQRAKHSRNGAVDQRIAAEIAGIVKNQMLKTRRNRTLHLLVTSGFRPAPKGEALVKDTAVKDTAKNPIVSVIMANFNGAPFIEQALSSVLSQTLSDLEVLVCDDASSDESVALVQAALLRDTRVKLITSPVNRGPGAARNAGLDQARGAWVSIMDCDDIMHPDRLAQMLKTATKNSLEAVADDLTYFHGDRYDPGHSLMAGFCTRTPRKITAKMLLEGGQRDVPQLGYLKPVFRRDAIGALRYREDIRIGEDFDLYLRYVLGGGDLHAVAQSFYLYRRHDGSVSHRMAPKDAAAMIRAQQDVMTGHRVEGDLRLAFEARRTALLEAGAFEAIAGEIKNRKFGCAAIMLARRPKLLRPLGRVAKAHFAARLRPPAQPANVVPIDRFLSRATPRLKPGATAPLVHVRTPTYNRPDALRRCLESLIAQTWQNWVCDVFNDGDPAAKDVIDALADPRIRFHQNAPRRMASKNIDACFSRDNPHDADFFFVLEDDNFVLPRFIEDNISVCNREGVEIVFRNQHIEFNSGTDAAFTGVGGILDGKFHERIYPADMFRLSLIAGIGVSNGGLFWSRDAASDLEVHMSCSSTLQEYLRTFAINEPIYVAMEPLAVWAENGVETTRDLGSSAGYFRRELSLKRSVGILQRAAWNLAKSDDRSRFLTHPAFGYSRQARARGLVKSHIGLRAGAALGWRETVNLAFRGGMIRLLGRPEPCVGRFIKMRGTSGA